MVGTTGKRERMAPLLVLFFTLAPRLGAAEASCSWTSPTGDYFDLSGLTKKDYWMVQDAQKNFKYYLNLCKNVEPPRECTDAHVHPSPALQVEAKSWKHRCKSLARLNVQTWNLLDPKDPQKGVELTYGGGEKCGKTPREIRFHFICSPHFDEGPLQIFETTKSCHYNVTWASKFGCPSGKSWFASASSTSSTSGGWSFFRFILFGLMVYTIGGCAYLKYTNRDTPIGLGTCPNVEFWVGSLEVCMKCWSTIWEKGINFIKGKQEPEKDFEDKYPMGKDRDQPPDYEANATNDGSDDDL